MKTLYDLGIEIQKIREAINGLQIKGSENASLVVYATEKCNSIIKFINELSTSQAREENSQNGNKEVNTDGQ